MAVTSPVSPPGADAPRSGQPSRQSLIWSRLHFVLRILGLTGFMVGGVGYVLALFQQELPASDAFSSWREGYAACCQAAQDAFQQPSEKWRTILLLSGVAAVALALLVEGVAVVFFTAGRRSAFGINAVLQGARRPAVDRCQCLVVREPVARGLHPRSAVHAAAVPPRSTDAARPR